MSARMACAGVSSGVGASGSGKVGLISGGVWAIEASNEEMAPARSRSWYLFSRDAARGGQWPRFEQLCTFVRSRTAAMTHCTTPRL